MRQKKQLRTFVDKFDKFFDCLNVSNHIVGQKYIINLYRKSKSEDFRLKVSCVHYADVV